jgi:L-alanine-DL-glutamate epimerase-like enolase superfamily enzyme
LEYFLPYEEISKAIAPDAFVPTNGFIDLPKKSGLGVTVDEGFLRAQKYAQMPARSFGVFHSSAL